MRTCILLGICISAPTMGYGADPDPALDFVMYRNPTPPSATPLFTFVDGSLDLWLKALERPETDSKIQAALAIAKAHRLGMKDTAKAIPILLRVLEHEQTPAVARLALAQALIELNARESAPSLWRLASSEDEQFRNLVEPVLARWGHQPAVETWLNRLDESKNFTLVRTIQCLATMREAKAIPRLTTFIFAGETTPNVQIEAAKALGIIRTSGGEKDATALISNNAMVSRLASAFILHQHRSDASIQLMQTLASDREPAVAAVAVMRLLELNPKHVLNVPALLAHGDLKLRELGIEALRRQPTIEHIETLSKLTGDLHPTARKNARIALVEYANKPELRDKVLQTCLTLVQSTDWRSLEQACFLAVQLDHKPAASFMVKHLRHSRGEIQLASSWALRRLSVAETLDDAYRFARDAQQGKVLIPKDQQAWTNHLAREKQLAQVLQYLGEHRYKPADAFLRLFIQPDANGGKGAIVAPLYAAGPEARAAAVWALGMIHEGTYVASIGTALEARLNATMPNDIEDDRVRQMCAITLGRMKSEASLNTLERYYGEQKPSENAVNNCCGWAIAHIKGIPQAPNGVAIKRSLRWFLVPIP